MGIAQRKEKGFYMQYIMLTISALLLAVNFALNKVYQGIKGTSPATGFGFSSLSGLFTAVVFFVINGFKLNFSWYSVIMATLLSSLIISYTLVGFRLLKSGTMTMYTLFLMTGGMIVPYVFGLLFLNEPFSWIRTLALILIIGGVILSNFNREKINLKQIMMCVIVFVLNGMVSVVSKLHQIENTYIAVTATEFVLIDGITRFIIAGILYLVTKNREEHATQKCIAKPAIIIAFSAVIGGVSYLLQLFGAATLPATILYPFITGGSIVLSSLVGVIVFKEKLSVNLIASVVICFIGTVMFL